MVIAHFSCREFRTGKRFSVEVILESDYSYDIYDGEIIQMSNGTLVHKHPPYFYHSEGGLDSSLPNFTLMIGAKHLSHDFIPTESLRIVISELEEKQAVLSQLQLLAECTELPLQRSDKLNQLHGAIPAEVKPCHIDRWLNIGEFRASDFQKNKIYVALNAKENNVKKISKLVQRKAFFVDAIEETDFVHWQGQVLVTWELDFSRAATHMKTLSESGTVNEIQFLKFNDRKLFRVIPESELLKETFKLITIHGPPMSGKTTCLKRIVDKCEDPVCFLTAKDLVERFESLDLNTISAQDLIVEKLGVKLSSPGDESPNLVIIAKDANAIEAKPRFYQIVNFLATILPNSRFILSTQNHPSEEIYPPLPQPCMHAKLLPISRTDIINYIVKGSPITLQKCQAEKIFFYYEKWLTKMPPPCLTVVLRALCKHVDYPRSLNMQLKITISPQEIYDKLLWLSFDLLVCKHPKLLGTYSLYKMYHMTYATDKLAPELKCHTKQQLLHDMKQFYETYLKEIRYQGFTESPDFMQYLLDLFSFRVLSGSVNGHSQFVDEYHSFFIRRYVQLESPTHLNDILGYTQLAVSFQFDIKNFNVADIVLLSRKKSNICRVLYESFILDKNIAIFKSFCEDCENAHFNIAKLLGFLHLERQEKFTVSALLLIAAAHLGFYKLFRHLIESNYKGLRMEHISIRERQSFRSLLHLLMYSSSDNDKTTVQNKISIINFVLDNHIFEVNTRDYFGNTPILERNVSFELVKHFLSKEAKLEDTNYTRHNIFHKNSDNPAFIARLIRDFPEIYYQHLFRLRSKSVPPKPMKVRINRNLQKEVNIDVSAIEILLAEMDKGNEGNQSLQKLAAFVCKTLNTRDLQHELQSVIFTKILKTDKLAFVYTKLCRIINTRIEGVAQHFSFSKQSHETMCQKESPFIVAVLTGFTNIALLLSHNVSKEWLKHLNDYELSLFFQALGKYFPNNRFEEVAQKLATERLSINPYLVQESLALGRLDLYRTCTEIFKYEIQSKAIPVNIDYGLSTNSPIVVNREPSLEVTSSSGSSSLSEIPDTLTSQHLLTSNSQFPERQLQVQKTFSPLHYVMENSMHESSEILDRKQDLIDYILNKYSTEPEVKNWQNALLLGRAHYQLVRYIIENRDVEIKAIQNSDRHNILNVCLQNIIDYSDYLGLGWSAYDISFCQHSQVIYLARKVGVNDLAKYQIKCIMERSQELVDIKIKDLNELGFDVPIIQSSQISNNPVTYVCES